MIDLSVNVNKIALIRNSREGNYPDVVAHAKTCIEAGAQGITVHPRPDQRHIRPGDVYQLAELSSHYPDIEFNVEGNPFADAAGSYPGFISLVESSKPDQCTLVPDSTDQLTSDHGFDLIVSGEKLRPIIKDLKQQGIRVSLFMDPDLEQIKLAKAVGADRIELYTGPYAAAWGSNQLSSCFQRYYEAAKYATDIGLGVNAGHDLNLENLGKFATIPGLLEVSIGHALIVEAIDKGLYATIKEYNKILSRGDL